LQALTFSHNLVTKISPFCISSQMLTVQFNALYNKKQASKNNSCLSNSELNALL